jgi:hypothetical protein
MGTIRWLILKAIARIGAYFEAREFPPATPEQIEAARFQMRQRAITDGITYRVDHLSAAVILDDLADWELEFRADHGT